MLDIVEYRGWDNIELSFLVLDYEKPKESGICITSIFEYVKFPHKVYFLSNGAKTEYQHNLYKHGLIDYLILSKRNNGCGIGHQELYRLVDTKYSILMQNDQFIFRKFEYSEFCHLKQLLEYNNVKSIGLANDPNNGKYSERANLMLTNEYLNIPAKGIGGPGPLESTHKWSEGTVNDWFVNNKFNFLIYDKPLVYDLGKYTIRELPDGGVLKWRTDTGELQIIVAPKEIPQISDFTNEEWRDMINGKWEPCRIPQKWQANSHNFWDRIPWAANL